MQGIPPIRTIHGRGRFTPIAPIVTFPIGPVGGYSYPYPYQQPEVTVVAPPAPAAAPQPSIIINQYYTPDSAKPQMQEYPEGSLPQPGETGSLRSYHAPGPASRLEPTESYVFLIALNDGKVYTARAYWVTDGTLSIVTTEDRLRRIPLNQVDRQKSIQLNEERKVDFQLPE